MSLKKKRMVAGDAGIVPEPGAVAECLAVEAKAHYSGSGFVVLNNINRLGYSDLQ